MTPLQIKKRLWLIGALPSSGPFGNPPIGGFSRTDPKFLTLTLDASLIGSFPKVNEQPSYLV